MFGTKTKSWLLIMTIDMVSTTIVTIVTIVSNSYYGSMVTTTIVTIVTNNNLLTCSPLLRSKTETF